MRYTLELLDPNGTLVGDPKEVEIEALARERIEQTIDTVVDGSTLQFRVRLVSE